MKTTHLLWLSVFYFTQLQAYNLPEQTTRAYICDDCSTLSHQSLQTQWPIHEIPLIDTPHEHKSYSYNQRVSAAQLQQGVTISTRAPGAVLRITPLGNGKNLPQLEIKTAKHSFMPLKMASTLYAQDEALDDALRSSEHQTMMQIKPELGFGAFTLKSTNKMTTSSETYLIHVFDRYSLIYLQVEPDAMHYQYGDQFSALISLKDNDTEYDLSKISADLINTEGQAIPLKLEKIKRNRFKANATLLSDLNTRGDNWYIEVAVDSLQEDGIIHRTARTAFSYSIPSASLTNIKKTSSQPLTFTATIEVATASRYALQAVLFRNDTSGEAVPVETSQNAQWLEPGKHTIKFSFDNSRQLAEDTLSVGYLHLTDYGQLKTVYQYNQPIKLSQLTD